MIEEVAGSPQAFDSLANDLKELPKETLSRELLICGIIPEAFAHDSSQEKLWAKYCDLLLAQALKSLRIDAEVLRARGDSADVFGKTNEYTLVGDAKAFRLSRTAKNQKDFKVGALDDWRRTNTFACLVAPLSQYPTNKSQIYKQATQKNVTLLSYVHLKFLLDFAPSSAFSLKTLWETPQSIAPSGSAVPYWSAIEAALLTITGISSETLDEFKKQEREQTKKAGQEGIAYWESEITRYRAFSREEAITHLIKSTGIENKIRTITRAIAESRSI